MPDTGGMSSKRIGIFVRNSAEVSIWMVAVTLANTLAAMGRDVLLILNESKGSDVHDISPRVRVRVFDRHRTAFAVLPLVRLLRLERLDCLIAFEDAPNTAALLARPFLRGATRIAITVHNNPLFSESDVDKPIWWFIRRLRPWLFPTADHVIAVSEGIRRTLVSRFRCRPEATTAIHNPINLVDIESLSQARPDHPWVARHSEPLIVSAGRLVTQKDYPTLLRAFARLRDRRPARLIVLGDGPDRPALEGLAVELGVRDAMDMPGFVRNPYAYMAAADVFVLSSRSEGFGNVLVEALACGTPVVATDCASGPAEILDNGSYGKLVPVGDWATLAEAIEKSLDGPRDSTRLKERASEFSPERIAKRYLSVIQQDRA